MTTSTRVADALVWRPRESLVGYIRSLSDGSITAYDGARLDGDDVVFPMEGRGPGGAPDAQVESGARELSFTGAVTFEGHFGMMSVELRAPRLVFQPDRLLLTARSPEHEDPGQRIEVAVAIRPTDASASSPEGRMVATTVPLILAAEGMGLFGGQYVAGDEMGTLSFDLPAVEHVPAAEMEETAMIDPAQEVAAAGRTNADPNVRLSLTVAERKVEADGVVSLTLADPTGAELPAWTPGSHIDVHLGDGLVRQYSLSSSSDDRERWRITVLHEELGAVSPRIHSTLHEGVTVETSLPRNTFALAPSPHYVFVAGGIGITPLVPMIEAAERSGSTWTLLYSGRTRERMAFVDELAHHGERARVIDTASQGRIDFDTYFAEPQPDTLVYACGPERMLEGLQAATAAWPSGSLHVERFTPKEIDESGDVEFEVEFADSGVTATIPVGRSILEVAEEHDIPVISSCAEGTCGTCETAVLEGLPDHRDSILSDEEQAEGRTMFICVSRSVGGCRLKLDL